jgi:hypothetical protein
MNCLQQYKWLWWGHPGMHALTFLKALRECDHVPASSVIKAISRMKTERATAST